MIITLTGPSGSGKTAITKAILDRLPNAKPVTSYTTREPRPSDLPDDFTHLDCDAFNRMRDAGKFLWTAQVADVRYGSTKQSVSDALRYEIAVRIMILVPDVLPKLYAFAEGMGKRDTITSFFIHVADEAVLRARMLERGDAPEKADARIKACRDYEQEANESGVDYIRVDNSGDLTATVETILKRIDG